MEIKSKELIEKIEHTKQTIENYPLEISEGTKKMKKEYHERAIENRNAYILNQKKEYSEYLKIIHEILNKRKDNMIPNTDLEIIESKKNEIEKYHKIIRYSENERKTEDKLGYLPIILRIQDKDHIDLEYINIRLNEIIKHLEKHGIKVTEQDFLYTMFTKRYMEVFFNSRTNPDFLKIMKEEFESLYWECPNIITHLRLSLEELLKKYQKELNIYCINKQTELLNEVDNQDIIKLCTTTKEQIKMLKDGDLKTIIESFLNKERAINDYLNESTIRRNLYNDFIVNGDFEILSDSDKKEFYDNIWSLDDVLTELKGYYKFEDIIVNILEKYKTKDSFKGVLSTKLKEIEKQEKEREKINKQYDKILKPKLFSSKKKRNGIGNALKNQINQIINQISIGKEELIECEMNDKILKCLNDDSTLLDVLVLLSSNTAYLKWIIAKNNSDLSNDDIFKIIDEFFDYCYSNHELLKKITILSDVDIEDIIYDKYRLLNIKLNKEMLNKDNIENLIAKLNTFRVINNVEMSNISFDEIKMMCEIGDLKDPSLE